MSVPRVLVVGSSNTDFIMGLAALPRVGETVTDGQFLQTFGGKGANQAVAAARAGGAVTLVCGVGRDPFGAQMIENFRREGIETGHIHQAPDAPSGSALVMFDRAGDNYLAVAPGANYALLPGHLRAELFAQADVVVLQMEIPDAVNRRALELAKQNKVPVVFNYAPARGAIALSDALTALIVNETEAAALCGQAVGSLAEAIVAAHWLRGRGPQIVIVTLGAGGAFVLSGEGEAHVPAPQVRALDSTAAGDTFCGAFAVAWAQSGAVSPSVEFAVAASALSVTRAGAQPSIPTRAEVEATR